MSSGGVRINAGRKKVGVIVNTRIEEQLIEQIEQYISGLSRAEKIRKCLLLGIEHKKSKIKNQASDTNTNAINKFFKVYTKLLTLLTDTEINNVKTLNKYLLGFFTTIIPNQETLNIPLETHNTIVSELEKFTWSLNEQDGYNSITPSTIGSVIEKVVNQKETGSYYTPKDTTGYIAKYSIVFSLLCKCNSPALAYHFYEQYDEQSNVGVLNDSSNPVEKLASAINQLSESEKKAVFDSILEFTIIDPTCGTGAFIIAAADVMIELYKSTNMYWHISLSDYVVNLFRNCLFGVDITESAIALIHLRCKLYLYNLGISRDIAETISFQFYCGDSLIKPNEKKSAKRFNWKSTFPSVFKSGGFDCIIGNPPYVESSKINVNINDYGEYKTKKCGNLYAYILENSLNILKDNAYMGIFALYSATDSFMTYKLFEYQLPLIKGEKKLYRLFTEIEMPLVVIVAEMELCGALVDLSYCQKLKEKYETKLSVIDKQLNDKLVSIEEIISKWKVSESGLEKERVFPPESIEDRTTPEKLERQYPLLDPLSGKRYKHGKTYASQLHDPIKLSSPKQLAILLYKVLGSVVVNKRKPTGTGKHEIEAIKYEAEMRLELLKEDTEECDNEVITKLEAIIDICSLLSKRRQVEKIITTYLNPVPKLANHWSDGKIRFHLTTSNRNLMIWGYPMAITRGKKLMEEMGLIIKKSH